MQMYTFYVYPLICADKFPSYDNERKSNFFLDSKVVPAKITMILWRWRLISTLLKELANAPRTLTHSLFVNWLSTRHEIILLSFHKDSYHMRSFWLFCQLKNHSLTFRLWLRSFISFIFVCCSVAATMVVTAFYLSAFSLSTFQVEAKNSYE